MLDQVKIKIISIILGSMIIWFGTASTATAHKISAAGWVEGNTVFVASYFSGGTRPDNAKVKVFDLEGKLLVEGNTNKNGEFQFTAPAKMAMKIHLDAGMGHQVSFTLPIGEFDDDFDAAVDEPTTEASSTSDSTIIAGINEKMLRQIVASEVGNQIKPIIRKLNKPEAGAGEPSLTDILGGVGYIIGLVGLAMFFNYRKKVSEISS